MTVEIHRCTTQRDINNRICTRFRQYCRNLGLYPHHNSGSPVHKLPTTAAALVARAFFARCVGEGATATEVLMGYGFCLDRGTGIGVVGIQVFLGRFDQVFLASPQPHGNGSRHEHRRVDTKEDTDSQRQCKVMQTGAAKKEHGQDHGFGRCMGDDGPAHGRGNRMVDHPVGIELRNLRKARGSGQKSPPIR